MDGGQQAHNGNGGCLDDNTVAAFLEGVLSERLRARVEQHIDRCENCRNLLSGAVDSTGAETGLATRIEGAGGGRRVLAQSGQRIADRYVLERELGRGGMAQVWRASDSKLRRDVAIKLMSRRSLAAASGFERFEREAMAIARLRSPYVVEIYDYGLADGCPFIVMEMLEGEDLRQRLKERGRLSVAEVANIVIDTAKGLSAAHEAGIVHRDLKPANIFLHRLELGEEQVKVFDFGVAKMLQDDAVPSAQTTAEGVMVGTPRYMSPEQTHGSKAIDHRSDLWSLGVIAYTALTGRFPFAGEGVGEIMTQITRETPQAPSTIDPDLPAAVDRFFARALAKAPADRHDSALQMATEMADIADVSITFPQSHRPVLDERGPGVPRLVARTAPADGQPQQRSWLRLRGPLLPVVVVAAVVGVLALRGGDQESEPSVGATAASSAVTRQSSAAGPIHSVSKSTPATSAPAGAQRTAPAVPTRSAHANPSALTGRAMTSAAPASSRSTTSAWPSATDASPAASPSKSVDPKDPYPGPF